MSSVKQLAGQTMWYGVSSIAARFLNYLLTPFLTYALTRADYGKMSLVYAALPVLNALFTYGMETAFFRFSNKEHDQKKIYNTTATSIIISTILFGAVLLFFHKPLATLAGVGNYPELIRLSVYIIMLDTLSIIPFAKLRHDGRPKKYAMVKVGGILINIFFTLFFLLLCKTAVEKNAASFLANFYSTKHNPVYYIVLANLFQAGVTLLLLYKEVFIIRLQLDVQLWKKIMIYASPLILVNLGGIVNETMDRQMLHKWVPGTQTFREEQVGIYSACYKLSILITLFVQAFKMGAEPFFFKQAGTTNQQRTYARVMKFFVIVICVMFLVVAMYLRIWKSFISSKEWEGLAVVPILLLANMFLGIYYNLAIWYKLGQKTSAGAYITLFGVLITIIINYFFIPRYSYMACAWATFFCYGSMMVISYIWGQKVYRIPYAWKKLTAYIVIAVLLFLISRGIAHIYTSAFFDIAIATILLLAYLRFIGFIEKKELPKLPIVGKYFKPVA
ncbi:MAG: oligosaccharide flippase family protein [Ferruginibacter sp.]